MIRNYHQNVTCTHMSTVGTKQQICSLSIAIRVITTSTRNKILYSTNIPPNSSGLMAFECKRVR